MALIKSISGIRGTIGGLQGDNLTPIDILKFTTAFAIIMKNNHPEQAIHVVVGRDARISGNMVNHLVCGTLLGMGRNGSHCTKGTWRYYHYCQPQSNAMECLETFE